MKQITNISVPIVFIVVLSAFEHNPGRSATIRDIKKDFVRLNDNTLVGKYEVSNGEYKLFMSYLKNTNHQDLYSKCLLDTAAWSKNEDLQDKYPSRKAYDNYPVVTVSHEAAIEYCRWLTAQYNADPKRTFKKIIARLPTEAEWTEAASGGNNNKLYPWDNYYLSNNKGEYLCNFLHLGDQSIYYDSTTKSYKVADVFIGYTSRALVFNPVNALPQTPSGLCNVSGNAAEMVAEKGLAKGGSYNDPGFDVRIASKKYYDSPSTEIGFRVLLEVVEK